MIKSYTDKMIVTIPNTTKVIFNHCQYPIENSDIIEIITIEMVSDKIIEIFNLTDSNLLFIKTESPLFDFCSINVIQI